MSEQDGLRRSRRVPKRRTNTDDSDVEDRSDRDRIRDRSRSPRPATARPSHGSVLGGSDREGGSDGEAGSDGEGGAVEAATPDGWRRIGDNHFRWTQRRRRPGSGDVDTLPGGATYEDPDSGRRPGNGRGFFAPGGRSVTSSHVMPWGTVSRGAGPQGFDGMDNESIDYGPFTTTHAGVELQPLPPAAPAEPRRAPPPGLAPMHTDARSHIITTDGLDDAAEIDRDPMGAVMGLSADEAFTFAGQQVPPGGAHHMHFQAHHQGGREEQDNAVAGAGGANQRHRIAEYAATRAVRDGFGPIMASATPTGAVDPAFHLADRLEYTLQTAGEPYENPLAFDFDLHDGTMPRAGDQGIANTHVDAEMAWSTIHRMFEHDDDPAQAASEFWGDDHESNDRFRSWKRARQGHDDRDDDDDDALGSDE